MMLDTFVRQMLNNQDEDVSTAQRLLNALRELDESTYNKVLADGVCTLHGVRYQVDRLGNIMNGGAEIGI